MNLEFETVKAVIRAWAIELAGEPGTGAKEIADDEITPKSGRSTRPPF